MYTQTTVNLKIFKEQERDYMQLVTFEKNSINKVKYLN